MYTFVENTSKSPLNNSKSKAAWTFSKSRRDKDMLNTTYCQNMYNLQNQTDLKRGVSFGIGNRFNYHHKETLDIPFYTVTEKNIRSSTPGFSFTNGREKYQKLSPEFSMVPDASSPGPAAYGDLAVFGKEGTKISFSGKPKGTYFDRSKENDGTPLYNPEDKNAKGRYVLSNYKSPTGIIMIKPSKSKSKERENSPGPADYDVSTVLKPNFKGEIYVSKYKTPKGFTFKGKGKLNERTVEGPGPGEYKVFSEFGYDKISKNHYGSDSTFVYKRRRIKEKTDWSELKEREKSLEPKFPPKKEKRVNTGKSEKKPKVDLHAIFGEPKKEKLKKSKEKKREEIKDDPVCDFSELMSFNKLRKLK